MKIKIRSSALNWLRVKPRKTGFVVADRTPYGVHGVRVFSYHTSEKAAAKRVRAAVKNGNSGRRIYQIEAD